MAVFCGSRSGASEVYEQGAALLGKEMAKRNITLVYGGSSIGIMGAIASTVMENGGQAIGVMPDFLDKKERTNQNLTELIVVESMHDRKAKMAELADGFLVLPGGAGTLEEFFEIFTWAQLGLHEKPFGLFNINNYYTPLIELFNHMAKEKFLDEKHRSMAIVDNDPAQLLDRLGGFEPPKINTTISEEQT
nr:TIGR00730 family Rossman fold protein [Thalassobacillus pellis]